MRIYAGLIIVVAFIGWTLYRLLVKRDLHQHKTEFKAGLFFMATWGMIYWWLLH